MATPEILDIWRSSENWAPGQWSAGSDMVDVLVTLSDGTRWSATMCSFTHISTLREKWLQSGECLSGSYVWAANLILVKDTSRSCLEAVLCDLMVSGEFSSALAQEQPLSPETGA